MAKEPEDSWRTRLERDRDVDKKQIDGFLDSAAGGWTIGIIIVLLVVAGFVTEFAG